MRSLWTKATSSRTLQRKNEGRGVYFLTGTPISNTIAEVYTLQRYMQYEELQAKGIDHFDSWASTFGQVTSGWELDATGVNYKLSFHVQIDLFRLIIFYISIYYLKLSIQRSPGKAPCIPLFSGYYSGYPCKLVS